MSDTIQFLSLFAGIGGMDLGLERAGMRCVGQVEIDPYCQRVLAKHWPDVPRWHDVKTFNRCAFYVWTGATADWNSGLIAAGFPCQPVSQNGKKKAQEDERWLWPEVCRIVREFGPRWVLLENVPGLLDRGIDSVLRDLAGIGYDAEWDCVPAAAFGAHHLRERVFLVAYPAGEGSQGQEPAGRVWGRGLLTQCDRWPAEPGVPRMGHGVPNRVDRTAALGNAVVPQVAEWIGRRIIDADRRATHAA